MKPKTIFKKSVNPADYLVHLVRISRNEKTGPIPVSTTSAATCPSDCAMRAGCYADSGRLAIHWKKVTAGERGTDWETFCRQIAALPKNQLWRHNQAGDLPGNGRNIDTGRLLDLVRANHGRRGFTYTHYSPAGMNGALIRAANTAGFTINLSANNLAHADTLADYQVGPVAVVVPSNTAERELRTPAGRRVVVCPATYRDDVSCATCELCQKSSAARAIVAFPSHGSRFKAIDIVVSK